MAGVHPLNIPGIEVPEYDYTWVTYDISGATAAGGDALGTLAPGVATRYLAIGYFHSGTDNTTYNSCDLHWETSGTQIFQWFNNRTLPFVFDSLEAPMIGDVNDGLHFLDATSAGEVRITLAYCYLDSALP